MDATELAILKNADLQEQDPEWRAYPESGTKSLFKSHELLRINLASPPNKSQRAARKRLDKAYNAFNETSTFDDVLVPFNDLDRLLFQGELKHRVFVEWCRHPDIIDRKGITVSPGSDDIPATRLGIHLHVEKAWFGGEFSRKKGDVWGILIHEMLHCYLQVVTGIDEEWWKGLEMCTCKTMVFHGPMWQESARRLAERLNLPGLELKCIDDYKGECHRWNSKEEQEDNRRWMAEGLLPLSASD